MDRQRARTVSRHVSRQARARIAAASLAVQPDLDKWGWVLAVLVGAGAALLPAVGWPALTLIVAGVGGMAGAQAHDRRARQLRRGRAYRDRGQLRQAERDRLAGQYRAAGQLVRTVERWSHDQQDRVRVTVRLVRFDGETYRTVTWGDIPPQLLGQVSSRARPGAPVRRTFLAGGEGMEKLAELRLLAERLTEYLRDADRRIR